MMEQKNDSASLNIIDQTFLAFYPNFNSENDIIK